VTSGVGKAFPSAPLDPSWISRYCPAAIVQVPIGHSGVTAQVLPLLAMYCTDHPVMSTLALPRLNSSMKSFLYAAPVFPPPPNI
jgi:hypothetical protein